MSTRHSFFGLTLLTCIIFETTAQDDLRLHSTRKDSGLEFSWPATTRNQDGSVAHPFFEVEHSSDLRQWQPIGERLHSPDATFGQTLGLTVSPTESLGFYRLHSFPPRGSKLASGGAEVFGYEEVFASELAKGGQISLAEFENSFAPSTTYLPQISWDPTTAQFWSNFNSIFDFKLDARELAVFRTNGFVVSERLRPSGLNGAGFADVFYNVWYHDLPIFVSTDAILQAWHRTYDALLEETEETYLFNSVQQILDEMALHLTQLSSETGDGVLKASVYDVDYYLAVARSLLSGNDVSSLLNQDARVTETLADISDLELRTKSDFFGQCRLIDFSQFQPRGHYTHSYRLSHYFQCMMWLGRIDFMLAGGPFERCPGILSFATPREIGSAVVLWDLLQRSGQFSAWLSVDRITQAFVGWSDSLGFGQLGGLLAGNGIRSVRDVPDLAALQKLQNEIAAGNLGVQNIRSDFFISPLGADQLQLPQSFLFFGRKFVPDSWVFSKTVFDSVLWAENGVTNKVMRRVPSALDIAFTVLGNDQVVPDLAARIFNTNAFQSLLHAERWRDGLPYQHNLAALRRVIDSQQPSAWESNIYMGWLAALRKLSEPTIDPTYPEAMRTRAWAMKTLNTQLASWTELRHDTILYAKQSSTAGFACFYPAGYVEPRTSFWQTLGQTTERAANLIQSLPYQGTYTQLVTHFEAPTNFVTATNIYSLCTIQSNQVAHLRRFATTLETLASLSAKELAKECFDTNDDLFIRNLIQVVGFLPQGSGGVRKYDGWYPQLFYRGVQFNSKFGYVPEASDFQENFGANAADRLVADVHTDFPDLGTGDPGSVLHEGIGNVNVLMIAIDSDQNDRMVFEGPVLSHYEFEIVGAPHRLTDTAWDEYLQGGFPFPGVDPNQVEGLIPPSWTRSYLVPRQ